MRALLCFLLLCFAQLASAQCYPVATPSGPTTFCSGNSVTLNASPGDTYQWYKDGNLITGAQTNSYVASVTGSYTVEIDSVGCVNMSPAVTVTVNTVPAQPGPITMSDDTVCVGSSVTFSIAAVAGATSYEWNVLCNSPVFQITTAASLMTQVQYSAISTPETHVIVTAVNACGSSTTSIDSIAIFSPVYTQGMNNDPDITYATNEVFICPNSPNNELNAFSHWAMGGYSGAPTGFQWYRNNVAIPGATGYTYNVIKGGSYKVIITTGNACQATIQKVPIHQIAPIVSSIDAITPVPMCEGGVVLLKVNFDMDGYDGTDFEWWWRRNDTSIGYPSWGSQYLVATHPGDYSIGLWGHGYNNMPTQCGSSPDMITVTMSNSQATPVSVTQSGMTLSATPGFASYQWYKNMAPISGATNADYTMNTWGDYFVLATDNNSCVSQSNITLDVNKVESKNGYVKVYPNPNTGAFTLHASIPDNDKSATISISDISARVIMNQQVTAKNGEIEVPIALEEQLSLGMYFLKLSSGSFNKVISFVKQ